MIGFIILAAGVIAAIVLVVKCVQGKNVLVERFRDCNVIVFGKKGRGKDLVFNKVINARQEPCYSNIQFNSKLCDVKCIGDFSVAPNTYNNFLDDNVVVVDKVLDERRDMYVSDGGIYLPSQYHALLDRKYPSLPIYYALSRHLTKSNIHINTQNLSRVWDKLREQADCYIRCERTHNILGFLFTEFVVYDYYESAKQGLQPFPHSFFSSSFNTAAYNEFVAHHGTIKRYIICQHVSRCKYDTRYFHKVLYGRVSPSPKSSKKTRT